LSGFLYIDLAAAEAAQDLLPAGREVIHRLRRFHAHFSDDLVQASADCPVGLACFALHLFDIAAIADKDFEKSQALRGETEEGRKLELADNTRAAYGAVKLGDDKRRRTTGAGLRDKWHLGYSNAASLANILNIVNTFGIKTNILVLCKYIMCYLPGRCLIRLIEVDNIHRFIRIMK
jgi:hypothetical protein